MEKNKTGKYLKYAIGEIVLVVIGILIALSINNWNEENKENQLKKNYYQQVLSDLEIDRAYAKRFIVLIDSSLIRYNVYKKSYKKPNLSTTEILENLSKNEFVVLDIAYKTSTIETLVSTGDIRLFKPELRDLLTRYNKSKLQTVKLTRSNALNATDLLKDSALKGMVFLTSNRLKNQSELKKIIKFENRFPDIFLALDAFFAYKEEIDKVAIWILNRDIDQANAIIEIIETELK